MALERWQVALRTATGDLIVNAVVRDEITRYDSTARRAPLSSHTWLEGSGARLPRELQIDMRLRDTGLGLAFAEDRRTQLREVLASCTSLVRAGRVIDVRGVIGPVTETPIYVGWRVSAQLLVAQGGAWADFVGTLNPLPEPGDMGAE